jgi:hypothetical protein
LVAEMKEERPLRLWPNEVAGLTRTSSETRPGAALATLSARQPPKDSPTTTAEL